MMKILKYFRKRFRRVKNDEKGIILFIVMSFIAIMLLSTVSLSTMIQRDVRFVEHINEEEQARFMAEAGINHALGKIKSDGFETRSDFNGTIDMGSYSVTFSQVGDRHLITSVGTVSGALETVSVEVADTTPTALNYFSGAGNDIRIMTHPWVNGSITGDIHANDDCVLRAQNRSQLTINGNVSASDDVDVTSRGSGAVTVSGSTTEGTGAITFPVFDYGAYKQTAIDDGLYYDASQTFGTTTLSPSNGIAYIEGDLVITGDITVNGSIIAESIDVLRGAVLAQIDATGQDVIIARTGNITARGDITIERAVVYAAQDIRSRDHWGPEITVNGCMLAGRNIDIWNDKSELDYTHIYIEPEMMEEGNFSVVSWNE